MHIHNLHTYIYTYTQLHAGTLRFDNNYTQLWEDYDSTCTRTHYISLEGRLQFLVGKTIHTHIHLMGHKQLHTIVGRLQ